MTAIQYLYEIAKSMEETIVVPSTFLEQTKATKDILKNDPSGFVSSILDFAVNTATVNLTIETPNTNLTETLNSWLANINERFLGRLPTGIKAIEKEYFRELWKGSSLIALRTQWAEVDGILLPTTMWLCKGEDIKIEEGNPNIKLIGQEKYSLDTGNGKIELINSDLDMTFIQKPYSNWFDKEPVPFLIQRGLYKNLRMSELISKKGERIISKALEYLLLLKKGDSELAKLGRPEFIYDEKDLTDIKNRFRKFLNENRHNKETPVYTTNFDTTIEHLMPDYSKVLSENLFAPVDKKLLGGLGIVDIVDGASSNRKESIMNPKPFISMINQGVEDFKTLLSDIIKSIIIKNIAKKRKSFSKSNKIVIHSGIINEFITDNLREHIRSAYDRGRLSTQTYLELGLSQDYGIEYKRREAEQKDNTAEVMAPPVIQATQNTSSPIGKEQIPESKKGPEADNYILSYEMTPEELELSKVFEMSPYKKNDELPDAIKDNMSSKLQTLFRKTFNKALFTHNDETKAFKIAWYVVKKQAHKKDDKWVENE